MRLFIDLDGVLADFDRHYFNEFGVLSHRDGPDTRAFWKRVARHGSFFRHMPLMPDALKLWDGVKHLEPTILTGLPHIPNAETHKREWVAQHLGEHVPVVCCLAREKCLHGRPGDVLIDDWAKYRHLWEEMGGVFILHTSARTSLDVLNERLHGQE